MASLFSLKIDNLRKRSRVLLTCMEENAKIVRKEVKKLCRKDSDRQSIRERYSDIWKLRNDSSGVGAALCSDNFRLSPKYESLSTPNMNAPRRLLVRQDRKSSKPSPPRRPVRECYCHLSGSETRRINQRSSRTKLRPKIPPSFCESQSSPVCGDGGDAYDALQDRKREPEVSVYSPPLSTATLRRAQKIDYTPRSQFLRKVQSKVNSLRTTSAQSSPRSFSPPSTRDFDARVDKDSKSVEETLRSKSEFPRKHDCLSVSKDAAGTCNKIPKKTLLPKKTIVSKKSNNDRHELFEPKIHGRRPTLRSPPPCKRTVRATVKDCHASRRKIEDRSNEKKSSGRPLDVRDNEKTCPCSEYGAGKLADEILENESLDSEINDIRKFRDKNYFDTHASNPSLLGSQCSGSLEQFRINERLFPEPMGKINRDKLVVSIPPCATRQKRSVHYFPRNIVRQEKSTTNNFRKRRCPSCPLIGHAIDLGALKIAHPPNSLALRYQKGIR